MFTTRAFIFLPLLLTSPIQMPATVHGRPGRLIVIEAACANIVRWHSCSEQLDLWSSPDGKTVIVCAPAPGAYQLLAWTAVNGVPSEAVRCTVIVETPEPPRSSNQKEIAHDRTRDRRQMRMD